MIGCICRALSLTATIQPRRTNAILIYGTGDACFLNTKVDIGLVVPLARIQPSRVPEQELRIQRLI